METAEEQGKKTTDNESKSFYKCVKNTNMTIQKSESVMTQMHVKGTEHSLITFPSPMLTTVL